MDNCEFDILNPIQQIQPFAVLLVLNLKDLRILAVSENALQFLETPTLCENIDDLFSLDDVSALFLDPPGLKNHIEKLAFIPETSAPYVFQVAMLNGLQLDAAAHFNPLDSSVVLLELANVECSAIDSRLESLNSLFLSENLKNEKSSGFITDFSRMASLMNSLAVSFARFADYKDSLEYFIEMLQKLTPYERILAYKFDDKWNGEVILEWLHPNTHLTGFKGLWFPASDIPPRARAMYEINRVVCIPDTQAVSQSLVWNSDYMGVLETSKLFSRAIHKHHLEYLQNMNARSSMTISIFSCGRLWGLIALHGTVPVHQSFQIRPFLNFLSGQISTNFDRISEIKRADRFQKIATIACPIDVVLIEQHRMLEADSKRLLEIFKADAIVMIIRKKIHPVVELSNAETTEITNLMKLLKKEPLEKISFSKSIKRDFQSGEFSIYAGYIFIPFDNEFHMIILRKERIFTFFWAGDPSSQIRGTKNGLVHLEPRASFERFKDMVKDECLEWTETDLLNSAILQTQTAVIINAIKEKEEALRKSFGHNLMLASFSHEVRTPIDAIMNYLGTILNHELKDLIEKSYMAGRSLLRILESLLELSRDEAKIDAIDESPFEIRKTIVNSIAMLGLEAEKKKLKLEKSIDPNVPEFIVSDEPKIQQIMVNLLTNAIKYTNEGGIKLSVMCKNPMEIQISVEDTGIGIAKEHSERIFQEFEQIKQEKAKRTGYGLGLSIVHRLVKILNGQINLESNAGKGSTFTVTIPYKKANSKISQENISKFERKLKILIAEDDEIARLLLKKFLHRKGHQVTETADGLECYQKFAKESFDVVLMDVEMPKCDGFESCRKIRDLERKENRSRIPIVITSGYDKRDITEECREADVSEIISKPVDFKELVKLLKRIALSQKI